METGRQRGQGRTEGKGEDAEQVLSLFSRPTPSAISEMTVPAGATGSLVDVAQFEQTP